jgi:DNA invertase Pin-like site-specific DNA recombinase
LVPRKALRVLEDICDRGITVVTLMDNREYTADSLDDDPTSLLTTIIMFIRRMRRALPRGAGARRLGRQAQERSDPPSNLSRAGLACTGQVHGKWDRIEERAEIVRRIYRETLEGRGTHAIAETLNREGVPVFGRGSQWHRSTVVKLLHSPSVVGTLVPHTLEYGPGGKTRQPQAEVPGYYPAVVDEEITGGSGPCT